MTMTKKTQDDEKSRLVNKEYGFRSSSSSSVTPVPSDDQRAAIESDLYEAVYVDGRQRATVAFREKLCVKHNISMEALVEAIETFNTDCADYFNDAGCDHDEEEFEDRLLARLETGCSRAEKEGRYNPDAIGPLTIVSARPKAPPRPKVKP
jgi:hypothetical protein